MKLDHFFAGTLRKEEIASAFLATALEGSVAYRCAFFGMLAGEDAAALSTMPWTVVVEEGRVDVSLRAPGVCVLIENKISAGAKQDAQLDRYYVSAREHAAPSDRVLALYVSPGAVGGSEVEMVMQRITQEGVHVSDKAFQFSWEDLTARVTVEVGVEPELVAGTQVVASVVARARRAKYLREGERLAISKMVDSALSEMDTGFPVALSRFSGKTYEEILSAHSNVTVWVDAAFEVSEEPPHPPVGIFDDEGKMKVTLRLQFKPAGHVKKTDSAFAWWNRLAEQRAVDVPGVGVFAAAGKGWLVCEKPILGPPDSLATLVAEHGASLLKWLSTEAERAQFPLNMAAPR